MRIIIFFFFSCTGEEALVVKFPTEREAERELISDELYVNVVYGLWEYKSYLLVPVSDMKTGHNLWIYDKNTGKRIWSGIKDGRGPGETISGLRNTYFADGVLTYYDDMKGSILRYQIDSILAGSFLYREERYDPPAWTLRVVDLGSNRLYMKNVGYSSPDLHEVSRFELQDCTGQTLCQYDNFPIRDPEPLEFIRTDYKIERLCYSEAENTVYAAVADRDGIRYLAKMPLWQYVFQCRALISNSSVPPSRIWPMVSFRTPSSPGWSRVPLRLTERT